MANEYCVNCSWASGSGNNLWCNYQKKYVNKFDTCRAFSRYNMAFELCEGASVPAGISSSGQALGAAVLPRSDTFLDLLRNLLASLRS